MSLHPFSRLKPSFGDVEVASCIGGAGESRGHALGMALEGGWREGRGLVHACCRGCAERGAERGAEGGHFDAWISD